MSKVMEGQISASGLKLAIVAGRFNGFIVDSLVSGALDGFRRTGGADGDATVYWAPGAFEIPQLLNRVLTKGGADAVVSLGAVISGSTPHFEYVAGAVARGVAEAARQAPVPVTFGVLTCDTIEQAIERAGTKAGNKGFEAVTAAIEMASLFRAMGG